MGKVIKVAFSGGDYSGKDTALKMIKSHYKGLSFSDSLKKIASQIFPWMEVDYSPEDKETLIVYQNKDTGEEFYPRKVWELLDILAQIDPDVYIRPVNAVENQLIEASNNENLTLRLCVKDIRRPRELAYCKKNGYYIIYIDTDDERWIKRLDTDDSLIIQFREKIRDQADIVYMNSKNNPNWRSDFYSFLSNQLYRLGDQYMSRILYEKSQRS